MKPSLRSLQTESGEDASSVLLSVVRGKKASAKFVDVARTVALRLTNKNHDELAQLIPVQVEKAEHYGTYLALKVPKAAADALAVAGGETADSLHITMFYGKGLTAEQAAAVEAVFAGLWKKYSPLKLSVVETGMFDGSESSDWMDVLWARPAGAKLYQLHDELTLNLAARGVVSTSKHEWSPHITLNYVTEPVETGRIDPVTFEVTEFVYSPGDTV